MSPESTTKAANASTPDATSGAAPAHAHPGVPRAGDVLAGKYRVERILGVGGMGVVVAATHLELDERVAVKFLLPDPPPNADSVARFVREARAAIKIRSEHVVRIFDVGRLETGAPFIVMEYLQGVDLSQLVERDGPLPVSEAVDYLLQACEALAAAHGLGIVHRDLKPANLFLTHETDGTPCVKVLDFGISKFNDGDGQGGVTTTATIMGTPCFMSPEQLRSTRDVDARADIWALGTILYALLTGSPPYYAETTADVAAKIIRDAPPSLKNVRGDVPAELEAVINRCLEKDRERRFPDVAGLAEALAGFGSDRAASAAIRIKRVSSAAPAAVGMAATLRSNPPVPVRLPPPPGAPTRTASAWGDAKPDERGSRRVWILSGAGVVGASAIIAAVLAFGTARRPLDVSTPAASAYERAQARPSPPLRPDEEARAVSPLSTQVKAQAAVPQPVTTAIAQRNPNPPSALGTPTISGRTAHAPAPATTAGGAAKPEASASAAVPVVPKPTGGPGASGLFDDPQ